MNKKKYVITKPAEWKICRENFSSLEELLQKFEISFELSKKLMAFDMMEDLKCTDRTMTKEELKLFLN